MVDLRFLEKIMEQKLIGVEAMRSFNFDTKVIQDGAEKKVRFGATMINIKAIFLEEHFSTQNMLIDSITWVAYFQALEERKITNKYLNKK